MALTHAPAPARRSRMLLGAAAAVIVLTIAAIAVFMWLPDKAGPAASTPTRPPASTSSSAPVAVPTLAPGGVTWSLVGQSAVPASGTDGPAQVNGCKASGFSHTPVGALVASAQISTRSGYSAGRSCWEPTITGQFVASADRDTLLGLLKEADANGQPAAAPGELSQIAGFRYISYTSDTAVIGLIRRTPQGTYAQTTLTLTWSGGDWSLVAPAAGHWPAVTTAVSSLAGAIAWGAQ